GSRVRFKRFGRPENASRHSEGEYCGSPLTRRKDHSEKQRRKNTIRNDARALSLYGHGPDMGADRPDCGSSAGANQTAPALGAEAVPSFLDDHATRRTGTDCPTAPSSRAG